MMRLNTRHIGVIVWLCCMLWSPITTASAADTTWQAIFDRLHALQLTEEHAKTIVAQAKSRAISPKVILTWIDSMEQLQHAGIPAFLMSDRLLQGLVKGVEIPLINQGLKQLHSNLLWAKALINKHVAKAAIREDKALFGQALKNLEAALRAGLSRKELEHILDNNQLTLAQVVTIARLAGNMHTKGVAKNTMQQLLQHVIQAGMTADELNAFNAKLSEWLVSGMSYEAILDKIDDLLIDLTFDKELQDAGSVTGAMDIFDLHQEMEQMDLLQDMDQDMLQEMQETPEEMQHDAPQFSPEW